MGISITSVSCAICGTQHDRRTAEVNQRIRENVLTKFYCSGKCRSLGVQTRQQVRCGSCAVSFYKRPSAIRKTNGNFCSKKCAAKTNNKRRAENGFSLKGKTKIVVCADCGVETIVAINAPAICLKCSSEKTKRRKIRALRRKRTSCECGRPFATKTGKYCRACSKHIHRMAGCRSAEIQTQNRRSKNEIYFAELCKKHFSNVKENARIFDGWDADIVLEDLKIAVLWNGNWHFKKITRKHSVLQVQTRDRIKLKKIRAAGYQPYVIEDRGAFNPKFVEEQFELFKNYGSLPP